MGMALDMAMEYNDSTSESVFVQMFFSLDGGCPWSRFNYRMLSITRLDIVVAGKTPAISCL